MKKYLMIMVLLNVLVPVQAENNSVRQVDSYSNFIKYVNESETDADLEEVVRILFFLRKAMVDNGYQCPPLRSMVIQTRKDLEDNNVFITDEDFDVLLLKVRKYEDK